MHDGEWSPSTIYERARRQLEAGVSFMVAACQQHVLEFGGRSWFRGSEHDFLAFAGVKTREKSSHGVFCAAHYRKDTRMATTGT